MKRTQVELRGRTLQACSHGSCEEPRVWDWPTCWEHLTSEERQTLKGNLAVELRTRRSLAGIVLTGVDLQGIDFTRADLSAAFLNGANLSYCKLVEANLRGTFFGGANLTKADLTRAELDGAVFSGAKLPGVTLLAYSISFGRMPINLHMESFRSAGPWSRPRIDETHPYASESTYRALKALFTADGHYDSSSWAAYCERLMQRDALWEDRRFSAWAGSLAFGVLCGYGEKPARVVSIMLAAVLAYALGYHVTEAIGTPRGQADFFTALYFSTATLAGFSFPDLTMKTDPLTRFIIASEAFAGIFALGLFVFTLTKRYVAR